MNTGLRPEVTVTRYDPMTDPNGTNRQCQSGAGGGKLWTVRGPDGYPRHVCAAHLANTVENCIVLVERAEYLERVGQPPQVQQ